jgi:hypothetical protein
MPILKDIPLSIMVDQVLKGQGMDPARVRESRPKLVALTEQAITIGIPMLAPAAIYERFQVLSLIHNRINLAGGCFLQGELIASQLAKAEEIVIAVCTIGGAISKRAVDLFDEDPALAMALDGLASVATEALANVLCSRINAFAAADEKKTSLPINPGMIGWSVEEGQTQIFSILDTSSVGVSLDIAQFMVPLKSLSLVIGLGTELETSGKTCDFCVLQKTCRYKTLGI